MFHVSGLVFRCRVASLIKVQDIRETGGWGRATQSQDITEQRRG